MIVAKKENQSIKMMRKDVQLFTNAATRLGIIVKQPCEVCGKLKVDAHHDDYSKPTEVRWLCRKHHSWHHRMKI